MKKGMGKDMADLVRQTYEYIREKQMGEASGHDWYHTLRVYKMAVRLAETQTEPVDGMVVELAALLHDIEDWKFHDGDEEAGPKAARAWLENCGAKEAVIEHITEIIRDLSYKGTEKKGEMATLEGRIVQDADRLDAVGAVGIARCFAYGGSAGHPFFDPEIPVRDTLTCEEYKDKAAKTSSVNHYFEKLFRLVDLYNTDEAKKIGRERHEYMKQYLERLLEECGAEDSSHYRLLKNVE